ncbi:MAG: hypothetical protein H0T76_04335 [Nannocystis sp.]|nr:hypothetical protein [Nannocystis sp.]MBA3545690.1 hypothetical protein [Nannocystis sp.]
MISLRTLLIACSLSQVSCAPIVYVLDEHTTTDPPADTTDDPTSQPGDTEPFPAPSCGDGLWNGDESDIDCGGPCQPCWPGQRCTWPGDCIEPVCTDGICGSLDNCQGAEQCPPPGPCRRWDCNPKTGCAPVPDLDADGQGCVADDLCVFAGLCKQGECLGPTLDCSGFNGPCRASFCDPGSGNCEIKWIAEGESCDDGLACTFGEQCIQGECETVLKPPKPLLTTDFNDPAGWVAEPPWQIGAAKPSKCADKLGDDPFQDHSPDFAEQLAGALIGDCLPMNGFPLGCLISPPLELQEFPGELWLRYWSVLNSGPPPMQSHIDVFDPKLQGWMPLVKFPEFTMEPEWTEHIVDLTPFIAPGLQVRFCHSALGGQIPPVGGWSLDDVSIGPPTCE